RSGVSIAFEATRIQALVGRLKRAGGADLAALTPITIATGAQTLSSITGQNGVIYLENVPPGRHRGRAEDPLGPCDFWLDVPNENEPLIDLREMVCERP